MRSLPIVALLFPLLFGTGPLQGEAKQEEKPQHVAEEVRKAWEKTDLFVSGWVRRDDGGILQYIEFDDGKVGDLPTFLTLTPVPGSFLKLPAPDRDFAIFVYPGPVKGARLDARDLKSVSEMQRLVMLALNNTTLPTGTLKQLAALKDLRQLYLVQVGLTDAALRDLRALQGLQSLSLNDNTALTSASMKEIGQLKQLRWLSLGHTQVTSLKDLKALEHLETLFLPGTRMTDAMLDDLAGFSKLSSLFLSGSALTDAGMKKLSRLKQLRVLKVNATAITDKGLMELAELKGLKNLSLQKTKVTPAGIRKLQEALPELKIES